MKNIKLEHIALSITDPEEVGSFYQNILGANVIRNFVLDKDLAGRIFGINRDTSVYLMQKDELFLELFLIPKQSSQNFQHICISINNRKEIVETALRNGYECIQIERNGKDLIFIKDKSRNIFEIKDGPDS